MAGKPSDSFAANSIKIACYFRCFQLTDVEAPFCGRRRARMMWPPSDGIDVRFGAAALQREPSRRMAVSGGQPPLPHPTPLAFIVMP